MAEEALPEPEEELIHLPLVIPNLDRELEDEREMKKSALEKLGKKCNRVHKYLHKMLKLLRENDPAFCDRFLENLKIDKEKWDELDPVAKITGLFPVFEKLIIVSRYHGLLKMFKEKMYRKLSALCRGYLKVFNTYKCFCPLEADKFIDKHKVEKSSGILAFTAEVRLFGYGRAEAEEAERYKVDETYRRKWCMMTLTSLKRTDPIIVMPSE